jgi:hypothetical protein
MRQVPACGRQRPHRQPRTSASETPCVSHAETERRLGFGEAVEELWASRAGDILTNQISDPITLDIIGHGKQSPKRRIQRGVLIEVGQIGFRSFTARANEVASCRMEVRDQNVHAVRGERRREQTALPSPNSTFRQKHSVSEERTQNARHYRRTNVVGRVRTQNMTDRAIANFW